MKSEMLRRIVVIDVEIAAPFNPNFGIRIIFNSIFRIDAQIMLIKIIFDFPTIEIKSVDRKTKLEINPPTARICKTLLAKIYCSPKSIRIKVVGKRNIIKNKGRFKMRIHFPTCLLNSFITLLFFIENSLVIIGKNNWENIAGIKAINPTSGVAAL